MYPDPRGLGRSCYYRRPLIRRGAAPDFESEDKEKKVTDISEDGDEERAASVETMRVLRVRPTRFGNGMMMGGTYEDGTMACGSRPQQMNEVWSQGCWK